MICIASWCITNYTAKQSTWQGLLPSRNEKQHVFWMDLCWEKKAFNFKGTGLGSLFLLLVLPWFWMRFSIISLEISLQECGLRAAVFTLPCWWQSGEKMQRSKFCLAATGCTTQPLVGLWEVLLIARFYLGRGKSSWDRMAQGMTNESFMMKLLSKPRQLWPKIIIGGIFDILGWVSRCPESSML